MSIDEVIENTWALLAPSISCSFVVRYSQRLRDSSRVFSRKQAIPT